MVGPGASLACSIVMLFSAYSYNLRIEREDFPKGLRELKRFAKESPAQLNDANGVLDSKSFPEALAAAWWQPELDEHGDIRALEYIGDKLPMGADTIDPFLRVLAKVTVDGSFNFWFAGEQMDGVYLSRGKLYDGRSGAFTQIGRAPRVKPGSTFALRFRVNNAYIPPAPHLRLRFIQTELGSCWFDMETTERPPCAGIEIIDSDLDGLEIGQEREVRISVSPEARGPTWMSFAETPPLKGSALVLRFDIETPLDEVMGWQIAHHEGGNADKLYRPADEKRTLLRLQRFAVRHAQHRGGEFLAPVVSANSLDEALAAVGLDRSDDKFRFTRSELPGSERMFLGVLESLAMFTNRDHSTTLKFRYAQAPDLIYSYRLDGGVRRDVEYVNNRYVTAPPRQWASMASSRE